MITITVILIAAAIAYAIYLVKRDQTIFKNHVKTFHDVGQAIINISTMNNEEYQVELSGLAGFQQHDMKVHIVTADDLFNQWIRHTSQDRLISITKTKFIPLSNVKLITVQFYPHQVLA